MQLKPETLAAWKELKESFDDLQRTLDSPANLAIFVDQLSRAKIVSADLESFIARLRDDRGR